jgi:DeoR/GlpR family transcriptional regulator of sugar metabolism
MSELAPGRRELVPAERRRQILEELRRRGSVTVANVEDLFNVSAMTARRDLALLADAGHVRRTHGGAVLPDLAGHEDSFESRLAVGVEAKRRIAAAVVAHLKVHETVFIDSSSSSYYVVREMIDAGLAATILTNSVPVMHIVGRSGTENLDLIGLGGNFRRLTRSLVGADTVRAIQRFYVDRVVFSVKGIEPDGSLTDPDPLESEVKRAMINRARNVVLVADSHKFDERGLNVVAHARTLDHAWLADPPSGGVALLESASVDVSQV